MKKIKSIISSQKKKIVVDEKVDDMDEMDERVDRSEYYVEADTERTIVEPSARLSNKKSEKKRNIKHQKDMRLKKQIKAAKTQKGKKVGKKNKK